jgi:hypothetical protein
VSTAQAFEDAVHRADWAGVPVLWADAPEPFTGALVFRVGRADETFRNGGLTHLAEHLAHTHIGRGPYQYNGRVETSVSTYYASGTRDEVLQHLRSVAAGLRDLPLDRLESEKRILETEASSAVPGLDARLMALRFGPVAYGLVNQAELGLGWVTPEHVSAWAAEYFTAGNAVVWLTGEPSADLEPLGLLEGERKPPPAPETIPTLDLPAHLADGTGGVALTVLAKRDTAIHAGFLIAIERAHAQLRRGAALSYAPGGAYLPLDGRTVHVMVNADCKDQDAPSVQDELLGILYALAEDGPTDEELEWDRTMLDRALRDPHWAAPMLDAEARDTLMGVQSPSRNELVQERAELTRESVARAIAETLDSLLVLAPSGVPASGSRPLAKYEPDDRNLVDGNAYPVTQEWEEWGEKSRLVVGEDGFSYARTDSDDVLSWSYANCIAGVQLLSGSMTVVGRDGSWVTVFPHRYLRGDEALRKIVGALGEDRLVPLSTREHELEPIVQRELGDRVGRVAPEVDLLGGVLGANEELRALAEARRGHQVGLLAVTDRRLIFHFWGTFEKELFEKPLTAISGAELKGLLKKALVVSYEGETTKFEDIKPSERAQEIAQLLSAS